MMCLNRLTSFLLAMVLMLTLSCNSSKTDSPVNTSGTQEYDNPGSTPSGYSITRYSTLDGVRPKVGDQVSYHQTIFQNDSVVFSTALRNVPITAVLPDTSTLPKPFPPDYEVVFFMAEGDSVSVLQELDTFSAAALPRGVTNEDVFIYHMKMEKIVPKDEIDKIIAAIKARETSVKDTMLQLIDDFETGKLEPKLTRTDSGIKYMIYDKGEGREIKSGNFVKVHFSGFLRDRTNFDNTFGAARPFTFRIDRGRVIAGWDEGIMMLNEGGRGVFFIPYNLAYGLAGKPPTIPEKADLVFYVEVVDVY